MAILKGWRGSKHFKPWILFQNWFWKEFFSSFETRELQGKRPSFPLFAQIKEVSMGDNNILQQQTSSNNWIYYDLFMFFSRKGMAYRNWWRSCQDEVFSCENLFFCLGYSSLSGFVICQTMIPRTENVEHIPKHILCLQNIICETISYGFSKDICPTWAFSTCGLSKPCLTPWSHGMVPVFLVNTSLFWLPRSSNSDIHPMCPAPSNLSSLWSQNRSLVPGLPFRWFATNISTLISLIRYDKPRSYSKSKNKKSAWPTYFIFPFESRWSMDFIKKKSPSLFFGVLVTAWEKIGTELLVQRLPELLWSRCH